MYVYIKRRGEGAFRTLPLPPCTLTSEPRRPPCAHFTIVDGFVSNFNYFLVLNENHKETDAGGHLQSNFYDLLLF